MSLILPSYSAFLTTSFFTTSLSLLKSVGTVSNKSAYYLVYLSMSNLSISAFKLAKSSFLAN